MRGEQRQCKCKTQEDNKARNVVGKRHNKREERWSGMGNEGTSILSLPTTPELPISCGNFTHKGSFGRVEEDAKDKPGYINGQMAQIAMRLDFNLVIIDNKYW